MQLKRLVLKGFKSFADRTVVNFEPGISVLVGPNGSGKSNISEAVLWVLGELRSSNLRVSNMEELIFAGSSAHPPAGMVEVDLVLDNSDNTLPIEYDEVVITRRLYHNGQSDYFINGAPSLRREVVDILHDSGIGEGAHCIITQGNLTSILDSKPTDRKALIEEAAGVLKHKARKDRAGRQMLKMEDTLTRVYDVIKFLDSRIKPLERQANKAQRYKDYKSELDEIEITLAVDDLRNMQEEWESSSKVVKEIEAEYEIAKLALAEKEEELLKRQLALEQSGVFVGDLQEQRRRVQSVMERLDSGMRLIEEKGKNMIGRLSDLRATIHQSESKLKALGEELEPAKAALLEGESRLGALTTEFKDVGRISEQINKKKHDVESEYNEVSKKISSLESALSSTKENLAKASGSMESMQTEETLLADRKNQLQDESNKIQESLIELRDSYATLTTEKTKVDSELDLAKSDIAKRDRLLDVAKRKESDLRESLSATKAEIIAIEEVDRALENSSEAFGWVMEREKEFSGLMGSLAQIFDAPEDVAPLLDKLLSNDIFGLLTADTNSSKDIILKLLSGSVKDGEISLIPLKDQRVYLGGLVQKSSDGERLLDKVTYAEQFSDVAESLIGDVYLASSLNEAMIFHGRDDIGVRFATRDGIVVSPNGKISMGKKISNVESVLTRKNRANKLLVLAEQLENELSEAEMEVSNAEEILALAQQDGFELSERQAKLIGEMQSLDSELKRLESSELKNKLLADEIASKLSDVARRKDQTAPLLKEYEDRIEKLDSEISGSVTLMEDVSSALTEVTNERNDTTERLSACKVELESISSQTQFLRRRIDTMNVEREQLEEILHMSRLTESKLALMGQRIDPLYSIFSDLYKGIIVIAKRLKEQTVLSQSDSSSLRNLIEEARAKTDGARAEIDLISEKLGSARVAQAKQETEVEHLIERIRETQSLPLEEALKVPSPENREQLEENRESLNRKIRLLGTVNEVAAEDYQEMIERRDFIKQQITDLEDAKLKLRNISNVLERKMKKQFRETFDAVNENFKELFEHMFPNGSAELVLIEDENTGEEGVDVTANPAGKRNLKLMSMSGGEQSLIALSLIFAIYRSKKTPFYFLDEVDHALDDVNQERFCAYLDKIRHDTQLIMVTHQRRTMEIADILFGITMQASAVSKLVTQRLEQALALVGE